MFEDWTVEGKQDSQLIRSDWTPADRSAIEGVATRSISNVLTDNGVLTEIWRADWALDDLPIGQVFQRVMAPGAISAWHAHRVTTDRLFCAIGRLKIVLYDGRGDSPTHRMVGEYRLGAERPAIVLVPPGVWHGVQNIGEGNAILLNLVDAAYDYESPDHFRAPVDTSDIPHRW
jgi:dTDP-4-dehydrorhamnose 3,5-epimerase